MAVVSPRLPAKAAHAPSVRTSSARCPKEDLPHPRRRMPPVNPLAPDGGKSVRARAPWQRLLQGPCPPPFVRGEDLHQLVVGQVSLDLRNQDTLDAALPRPGRWVTAGTTGAARKASAPGRPGIGPCIPALPCVCTAVQGGHRGVRPDRFPCATGGDSDAGPGTLGGCRDRRHRARWRSGGAAAEGGAGAVVGAQLFPVDGVAEVHLHGAGAPFGQRITIDRVIGLRWGRPRDWPGRSSSPFPSVRRVR